MVEDQVKTSVIIPNWNGLELLKLCLLSLKEQTLKHFEVVIVDNGSTDGSAEYIKLKFTDYKLIKLDQNVGFAPAVNIGIQAARGEYLVLLNNDTKVDPGCLKYLEEAADKHPEVGMVAAKMLQYYRPDVIDSTGDYIDVVGHADNIGRGQKDGPKYSVSGYIFLVTGGGSLYKRSMFEKIGLFDEDYFAYMEDVDLGLRAQMAGYKAWFEPKARIYHIHKATSSRNSALLEYLQFRNMTQTIIKDFPKGLLLTNFNWLRILAVNLNTVRFLASQGKILSALKAEWYIIQHIGQLLRKRRQILKMRRVSDQYLITNFELKKLKIPFLGRI